MRVTGSVTIRSLRLLELFTPAAPRLTLSDLARKSGYPLSTVHRLAGDLIEWGALERDSSGRFTVGLKLWEIASLAPRGTMLRELAMPVMEDLSQITRENVQLGVCEGTEVVFVERIAGQKAVPVHTRVGGRFPLTASGIGLALLAYMPADVQEAVLAAPIEKFTERTITDPSVLRRVLAEIRRSEVAISDRQVTMDAVSVAAPIFERPGTAIAAVSLVVSAEGASPSTLVPLVRAAARTISRAVRPRPPL
ncbi:IclR family transcriptional regulator [Rhodococcus tibetensis]|uniref:IclR family transcriptional regulator n=1 Tax=Rhodococcus tibetensis TaxID=2965064 RepID=UPI0027E255C5|nr:IclR family transcriptional regulator [Rhodococcus sp. FXJ9.536]